MIGLESALVVFVEPMANIATVATIAILTENFWSFLIVLLFNMSNVADKITVKKV